jgi:hypothetical protein
MNQSLSRGVKKMADKRPGKPEPVPPKKASDTVQLTAEDLRKISGGATVPPPSPQPKDIKKG